MHRYNITAAYAAPHTAAKRPCKVLRPQVVTVEGEATSTTKENELTRTSVVSTPAISPISPNMPSRKRNGELLQTHYYDEKLDEVLQSIRPQLQTIASIPISEKINVLTNKLWPSLALAVHPHSVSVTATAKHFFDCIVADISSPANYDARNNLRAEDLLYMCSYNEYITNVDFCKSLLEQLSDVSGGPCPQGRCARILQLILSFSC